MSRINGYEIWAPHEVLYIQAMLFNSNSALDSVELIKNELGRFTNAESDSSFPTKSVLDQLQNVIVQAAALSRYFWPARRGHEIRASQLRDALGVTESSPLKDRNLRNEIEHFDEKLDAYLADGISGYVVPELVAPLPGDNDIPCHIFRAYYTAVAVFEMLGKRYEFQPLAEEVKRIHERLLLLDRNGGRLESR
jgi:hypothetical protein